MIAYYLKDVSRLINDALVIPSGARVVGYLNTQHEIWQDFDDTDVADTLSNKNTIRVQDYSDELQAILRAESLSYQSHVLPVMKRKLLDKKVSNARDTAGFSTKGILGTSE